MPIDPNSPSSEQSEAETLCERLVSAHAANLHVARKLIQALVDTATKGEALMLMRIDQDLKAIEGRYL